MKSLDVILNELSNKRVAFLHSHVLWPSHLETELELMDLLKSRNVEVFNFVCNDGLKPCDQIDSITKDVCARCIKKRRVGLSLSNIGHEIPIGISKNSFELNPNISIGDFVKIKHKNFDVGYAVLSSVVHLTRDPYLRVKDHYALFKLFIENAIALYEYFLKQLIKYKIEHAIIFNGRFVYTRSLLRACEALGISYHTHERGSSIEKFMLFENTLPHDLDNFHSTMEAVWLNSDLSDEDKERIADDFFISRREGAPRDWFSFVSSQNQKKLPENWDNNKYNIAIFLSSEDEFNAIGDTWTRPLFQSQLEGLQYIFNSIEMDSLFHFYIRMHPNSINAVHFRDQVKEFENEHITVIDADSDVSSYKLLFSTNKAVTFGSTIGIEATYWSKPSINLDNALYYQLDVTYNPKTLDEIIPLILDKSLSPKARCGTFKYGFFLSTFGYDFRNYNANDFLSGTYKGVNLNLIEGLNINKGLKNKFLFPWVRKKILNARTHLAYFWQVKLARKIKKTYLLKNSFGD